MVQEENEQILILACSCVCSDGMTPLLLLDSTVNYSALLNIALCNIIYAVSVQGKNLSEFKTRLRTMDFSYTLLGKP